MALADRLRRLVRRIAPRPAILMYHRVAQPAFDPWALAVSPVNFEAQMRTLAARRTVLTLEAFQARAGAGNLPADAVAVTFDDGYVDNCRAALPILKRCGVPATFFISTGFLGARQEFWWDELARLVLGREAALDAIVAVGGEDVAIRLAPISAAEHHAARAWRASSPAEGPRTTLFYDLWSHLQRLDDPTRDGVMSQIRVLFGASAPDAGDLPMTADEVRAMAAEPLVTIGAHSVNHRRLPDLADDELAAEIAGSRAACEALTGAPVHTFAYPYGANDEASRVAVREAGLTLACTTDYATVPRRGADPFALPRIHAADEDAAALLRRLSAA